MHTLRHYINLIKENELVEPEVNTKTVQKLDLEKLDKLHRKGFGREKTGYYAYAKELDPHQVRLTTYKPDVKERDAKFNYIQAIKHLIGKNSFVPTVYEIRIVKAKNINPEMQKVSYVMQNLLSYREVPTLLLLPMVEKLVKSITNLDQNLNGLHVRSLHNQAIAMVDRIEDITSSIMSGNRANISNTINIECQKLITDLLVGILERNFVTDDKELNEVLDIIRAVATKYHYLYDFNTGNVMYRQTKFGCQLVITDPLAG